jgi:hypothetical protein
VGRLSYADLPRSRAAVPEHLLPEVCQQEGLVRKKWADSEERVKPWKWSRTDRTFKCHIPDKAMAFVFGSAGKYPMWAWVVYRSGGTVSGVTQTLAAAKKRATEALSEVIEERRSA